jgi:hypothetical protein
MVESTMVEHSMGERSEPPERRAQIRAQLHSMLLTLSCMQPTQGS